MRRSMLIVGAALLASSHSGGGAPTADQKLVEGDWVLVSFKGDPNAFGSLHLKPDGTFEGEMGDKTPKENKSSKIAGTYILDRQFVSDQSVLFVEFTVATMDGKNAPAETVFRLGFAPKSETLSDLLSQIYTRPGNEGKVRQMLERQRAVRRDSKLSPVPK
ncbi:MAG: hypothetical protein JST12_19535 [Armatimonadetes bacterium]|nr:hypothetical protein [Armatimonadota bacterium]